MGLSSDELEFIAEFLGACIIESNQPLPSRALLADKITQFHESCGASGAALDDRDHKIILVREYLCRAGNEQRSPRARTAAS